MRLFYAILQKTIPKLVFYIPNSSDWHLTIDDSPSANTPYILDLLDTYQVKAIFFCIGSHIELYPEYFQEIVNRGHSVGYHSYAHENAWRQSIGKFEKDFEKCKNLFSSAIYRPPYGKLGIFSYLKIWKKLNKIVLWDILTEDWKYGIDPRQKIQSKIAKAQAGSIIVFHDNEKSFENIKIMLPYFLEYAENRKIKIALPEFSI